MSTEWRDYCIETAGMPLSACSYFQYEEFPGFMTFYYVAMLLVFVIEIVVRVCKPCSNTKNRLLVPR